MSGLPIAIVAMGLCLLAVPSLVAAGNGATDWKPEHPFYELPSEPILPPGSIRFDEGSGEISKDASRTIRELAAWLGDNPHLKIVVEGHADDPGSEEENDRLSLERALAVSHQLLELGIPEERVSVKGYGRRRPAVQGEGDSVARWNRRVDFRFWRSQAS